MLNKNDKKNIVIIILVLIVLVGLLAGIRGCTKKEKEETPINPEVIIPTDEENSEEKESQGQSEDVSISKIVSKVEEVEKDNYPVISIEKDYYQVSLNENFVLPEISSLDENGNELKIYVTYKFMSLESSEYLSTLEFSTSRLGIYKITYHVENNLGYVTVKDIYVEIIDDEAPVIEGIISKYNSESGVTSFIPVLSNEKINQEIDINFYDNDKVNYVEYYNASKSNVIEGSTLEDEAMPTVYELDGDSTLTLTEEGEYHIRAFDRSGNVTEYIVIIDKTMEEVEVNYKQIDNNTTLITLTSNEELSEKEGFKLSEDKKVLTKIVTGSVEEYIIINDLAGNTLGININYEPLYIQVIQDELPVTGNTNVLNSNNGSIKVVSNKPDSIIMYSLNESSPILYINGSNLTQDGLYDFIINYNDYELNLSLEISSLGTEN